MGKYSDLYNPLSLADNLFHSRNAGEAFGALERFVGLKTGERNDGSGSYGHSTAEIMDGIAQADERTLSDMLESSDVIPIDYRNAMEKRLEQLVSERHAEYAGKIREALGPEKGNRLVFTVHDGRPASFWLSGETEKEILKSGDCFAVPAVLYVPEGEDQTLRSGHVVGKMNCGYFDRNRISDAVFIDGETGEEHALRDGARRPNSYQYAVNSIEFHMPSPVETDLDIADVFRSRGLTDALAEALYHYRLEHDRDFRDFTEMCRAIGENPGSEETRQKVLRSVFDGHEYPEAMSYLERTGDIGAGKVTLLEKKDDGTIGVHAGRGGSGGPDIYRMSLEDVRLSRTCGGYLDKEERQLVFRHGKDTVFINAEGPTHMYDHDVRVNFAGPLAERVKALPETLEALFAASKGEGSRRYSRDGEVFGDNLSEIIQDVFHPEEGVHIVFDGEPSGKAGPADPLNHIHVPAKGCNIMVCFRDGSDIIEMRDNFAYGSGRFRVREAGELNVNHEKFLKLMTAAHKNPEVIADVVSKNLDRMHSAPGWNDAKVARKIVRAQKKTRKPDGKTRSRERD